MAWLSLDQGDRQPATFWTYVITALQTAVPGVGADVLPLLQSAQPPIETVLVSVLNELAATPNEVVLVLDDYHLVDGPDIRDGMTFLLEHLPPHVHLVISSRADPLLPLARLRARGELVEVRAADLRFTPDEVAAYLNDVTGLDLTPDDIAALEGRTEGWIAALQLAALSMQGRDGHRRIHRPVRRERPVHRRLPRRGGAAGINPTRFANSCCTRRFSTGSPGRSVTPSPAATTAASCSSPWSAPTCSSCPWTIGGSGTATTTCSPTCCGRTCSPSSRTWFRSCTSAPASGTSATTSPRRRSGTPWPPGTSTARPT